MFLLILGQDADRDMPQSLCPKLVCAVQVYGVGAAGNQMWDLD